MSQQSQYSEQHESNWIWWFTNLQDHHFICMVDSQYIKDTSNLFGLSKKIQHYKYYAHQLRKALQLILRPQSPNQKEINDQKFVKLHAQATDLYGLIHARYITTPLGLAIMREKYLGGKFGHCPRVLCEKQNAIPIGISEDLKIARVKIYCPRCRDIFEPRKKVADIDGAYFGSSFPHLLLMTYPDIKPLFRKQQYVPMLYGFKIEPQSAPREFSPSKKNAQLSIHEVVNGDIDQDLVIPKKRKHKK